ncbi:hypothetical protein C455_09528 [Haloferax larsenii JCM 13917]|nr:LamG-like jellyroll fold domain-containing protein [Haloferax larsenii]ELZ79115.1 hypothetical protein C455_09528 [Haloferax larsenii JCM 13917]
MTKKWTRRGALAFLASGAGMLAVDTAGFTTINADRASTLRTEADSNALLGVDDTHVEGSDGDSVTLTTLTNRFDVPLTWFHVDVPLGAPIRDVETPRQLAPGEEGDIEATLSCSREETTSVELTISAGGNDQEVELTRDFTVVCDDPQVARWTFSEPKNTSTLDDEWGSHTARRSRSTWPQTWPRNAVPKNRTLRFNGNRDVVTVRDDDELDLTSDFTLSIWVRYWENPSHDLARLFSKWNSVGDESYQFFIAERPFSDRDHEIVIETTERYELTGISVREGHWQLLTWTHSDERDHVYVNEACYDVPSVPDAQPSEQPLRIGNGLDHGGNLDYGFTGLLDDARIYSRELKPEEVRNLYYHGNIDG